MAKISLSKTLNIRNRLRVASFFAAIVLVVIVSVLVTSRRPAGVKAATTGWTLSGDTYTLQGKLLVTYNGDLLPDNQFDSGVTMPALNIENKKIIVDGANIPTTLTFAGPDQNGGAITLQSLTVQNGAVVTHQGPDTDHPEFRYLDNYNRAPKMKEWFGAFYEGYVYPGATDYTNFSLNVDTGAKIYWAETTATWPPSAVTSLTNKTVSKNKIYHFKIFFYANTGDSSCYFTLNGSQAPLDIFYTDSAHSSGQGKVLAQYFINPTHSTTPAPSSEGLSDTAVLFNPHYAVTPLINEEALIKRDTTDPLVRNSHYWPAANANYNSYADPVIGSGTTNTRRLDLSVTDGITLKNGGKIDASGKGYSGGDGGVSRWTYVNGDTNGWPTGVNGRGGKEYANTNTYNYFGGGGGGYGGSGGNGMGSVLGITYTEIGFTWGTAISTTSSYTPIDLGAGGGSAYNTAVPNYVSEGGAGGGSIHISTSQMSLSANSSILANGNGGISHMLSPAYFGGGGSGGSIWLQADTILGSIGSSESPQVNPGDTVHGAKGTQGVVLWSGANTVRNFGSNIQANGGSGETTGTYAKYESAGSGGGGIIRIESDQVDQNCTLVPGDTVIPGACENQDVVIDGTGYIDPTSGSPDWRDEQNMWPASMDDDNFFTVDAGAIQVWQQPTDGGSLPSGALVGQQCSDANNKYCDSRRHFNSLKVENNAVLTHAAITIAEMSQDTDGDKSLADETKGTARWKKVDLVVTGDITLESGGKISADRKGYPGGKADELTYGNPGYGPGGGFGPTGGDCGPGNDHSDGGGGSSGGQGGTSCQGSQIAVYSYPGGSYTHQMDNFEFGSGGASVYKPENGYHAGSNGSAGGGRVFLQANFININSSDSKISANGRPGISGFDTYGSAHSGAGAGGTVWIITQEINYFSTANLFIANANAGESNSESPSPYAQPGFIDMPVTLYNISATGGDADTHGSAGGGGWVIVQYLNLSLDVVKKTLEPVYRAGAGDNGDLDSDTNDNFNPYALQKNDVIKVNLYISKNAGSVSINDEILKSVTSTKCVPNPSGYPSVTDSGTYDATRGIVKWTSLISTSGDDYAESYYCKVQ